MSIRMSFFDFFTIIIILPIRRFSLFIVASVLCFIQRSIFLHSLTQKILESKVEYFQK